MKRTSRLKKVFKVQKASRSRSRAVAGRVVIESFDSLILADNPLRDPTCRQIPVYLPPSYDGKRRFPVIYLLAGFTGTGRSFLNYSFGGSTLPQRLDRLIGEERCKEVIVVMPDCMTRYGGSQYINSTATGRYEDHLIDELIPFIDRQFATKADRKNRAVAGKSSGGYGALVLGMRHPRVFAALACHSGDMFFDLCYQADFAAAARYLRRYDYRPGAFVKAYEAAPKKPHGAFPLLDLIGMSAAYSPNPSRAAPENYDLPFDPITCERRPDVWKRWVQHDPLRLIERRAAQAALAGMKLVYVDCGSEDEFFLDFGARRLNKRLDELRIRHRYEEFADSHMDISYRFDVSLPLLAAAIS